MLKDFKCHTTLPVSDLDAARAWYAQTLGLVDTVQANQGAVILSAAGGTRLALFRTPNTSRGGHTQIGFDVPDIEAAVDDLKSRGIVFEEYDMPGFKSVNGIVDTPPTRAAWFKDPDNNLIGLVQLTS